MSRVDEMIDCEDYDEDSCAWSRREAARIKQIQIGKSRPEYQRYLREVPHNRRSSSQPGTPDPRARVSKRQFDRALGDWRRRLHEFDAVPRGPPRTHQQAELEASWAPQLPQTSWSSPEKNAGGKGGMSSSQHQDSQGALGSPTGRSANRRSRGGAGVAPRAERIGKFGPRKPVDSPISDQQPLQDQPVLPPPPPPPLMPQGNAATQPGAVRISLADQLMEMPMMPPQMMAPAPDCYWYPGAEAWGQMETPQKGYDMNQFMSMETPPDNKPMMPAHMMHMQMYDEATMKADYSFMPGYSMPVESDMLPHRLFDSSPEKSDQGQMLENNSNSDTTTTGDSPDNKEAPASPRVRPRGEDSLMPLMSPPAKFLGTPFASDLLGTPIPTTPKRQYHVPETPSPDRMHCSWMQPNMPYAHPVLQGGLPWNYGAMPQQPDLVSPDFLQMMSCVHQEGQVFDHQI